LTLNQVSLTKSQENMTIPLDAHVAMRGTFGNFRASPPSDRRRRTRPSAKKL
jgi:hypothetical protein